MPKRVLVCPLDWGLGHATRCVPVIRELLRQGASPLLAGSGPSGAVLRESFPNLPYLSLPSYGIRYPSRYMVWNMAVQLPRIARAVWTEHRLIDRWIGSYRIDGIISDHRYGCFSRRCPSVFLSHQLHLIIPGAFLHYCGNRIHRFFIHRFDYCWIPDLPGESNLAGRLAHPPISRKDRYIGRLSRLEKKKAGIRYDLLMLLSGPEPQRSYLENILLKQAGTLKIRSLLVRGVPGEGNKRRWEGSVEVVDYLPAGELSEVVAASEIVLCRSGYSTLMDLAELDKRAILIPTPGQTEQEYLARQLYDRRICLYRPQQNLNLEHIMIEADEFPGFTPMPSNPLKLRDAATEFLQRL